MATSDIEKDKKRRATREGEESPSFFLRQLFDHGSWQLHPGRALDIATGKGRNALFLAEKGFRVEAIDASETALQEAQKRADEKGLRVAFRQADVTTVEFSDTTYDMILNFNFLERSLIPKIKRALKLGGYVVFETYLVEQRVLGHPKNPLYLLGHNELLEFFRDFRILYYREGKSVKDGKEAYRAGLFGQKLR